MNGGISSGSTFDWRDLFGFASVFVGVIALAVLVIILLGYNKTPGEVTAIVGVVASPIVAIVSAYFGISVASKSQGQTLDAQTHALDAQKSQVDQGFKAALAADPNSDVVKTLLGEGAQR